MEQPCDRRDNYGSAVLPGQLCLPTLMSSSSSAVHGVDIELYPNAHTFPYCLLQVIMYFRIKKNRQCCMRLNIGGKLH